MAKKLFFSSIISRFSRQKPKTGPALSRKKPKNLPVPIPPSKPVKKRSRLSPGLKKVIGQHNIPAKRIASAKQVKEEIKKAKENLKAKNLKATRLHYRKALVLYHELSDKQQLETDPVIREFEKLLEEKSFKISMDQIHKAVSENDLFKAKDEIKRIDFGLT